MKSRGATYLLLAAVVAVWGVIGWKVLSPKASDCATTTEKKTKAPRSEPAADSLRLNYPDPFLKNETLEPAVVSVVRRLPSPRLAPKRERIAITHLGTVVSAGQTLHILSLGNEQYELRQGESAAGFTLRNGDADSLYLLKDAIIYGVKRCE